MAGAASSTIAHYDRRAAEYADVLRGHDTAECRDAFLAELPGPAPHAVLDLGCGPGRDLAVFTAAGHRAIGLDGCAALAAIARKATGAPVWEQDILALDLPPAAFDGVFAQAVLFHVPTTSLPDVLARLRAALRPGGVLFACDPTGDGTEGWAGDRYVAFRRPQRWKALVRAAGFAPVRDWRRPPGVPRRRQDWLASLWRVAVPDAPCPSGV